MALLRWWCVCMWGDGVAFSFPYHHPSLVGTVSDFGQELHSCCYSSWSVQNKLWRFLASYNEKRPLNAREHIPTLSLTHQSEWMNEHMLVLLVEINLKALKKAQLKIYLFKFLTSKKILESFISKVLLWNSRTVLVSYFWHPWGFNSKLWAFFSLELEKETKNYMGKPTAHLGWIHRD